jgi:hypothetical protein
MGLYLGEAGALPTGEKFRSLGLTLRWLSRSDFRAYR